MTARHVFVDIFLALGVALCLVSCIGVLVARDAYTRLHLISPTTLAAVCIAVAVLVKDSFSLVGDKALLVAAFLVVGSPLLTHATGRAARIAQRGDWRIGKDEEIEVEQP